MLSGLLVSIPSNAQSEYGEEAPPFEPEGYTEIEIGGKIVTVPYIIDEKTGEKIILDLGELQNKTLGQPGN